jgi:hypothetical protein
VEELHDKSMDGKSLVFSQFNGMLDKIGEGLRPTKHKIHTGSMAAHR